MKGAVSAQIAPLAYEPETREELQRILFPNMGHLNLPKVHKWVRDRTGLKGM